MPDQLEALGIELARLGHACRDDGARLHVDAPAGSTATVSCSPPSYLCTFTLLVDVSASVAWADWTAKLRRDVARVWPEVAGLSARAPVAVPPVPEPASEPPREPVFDHAHAIGPLVDSAFAMSQDETQRGRFRVVTTWRREVSDARWNGEVPEYVDGPTVHWHDWGAATAFAAGAAKGWASLHLRTVEAVGHAARPVEQLLLRAAEGERLPSGIIALDFRGLPAQTVYAVIQTMVARVRSSDGHRAGVICLCDENVALWAARDLDLDVGA